MATLEKFFKPLAYRRYMSALVGMWLIAFAIGSRFGQSMHGFTWVIFISGLLIHGVGMHAAHVQPHRSAKP